ncbi:MAG TPA: hypothetical protein VNK95_19855 [Caldilineaceae bacterium]|nr:hypothetical protein [Caldilineaceae bacterium]
MRKQPIAAIRLPLFRKGLLSLGIAGLATGLAAPITQAAPRLQESQPESQSGAQLWPVLLPLMAAAIAVERAIEVIWNYIDWVLLNVRGWTPTDLKSSQYMQFKSGTSLVIGVVLGILISNYTGMRLFDYLRPLAPRFLETVPPVWDVLITGFIIGAGTKPTHDLLGIITQTKNLLGNSAIRQREAAGAALAEGVLKLAQSDAQALIDVPGVGPARIAAPGQGMRDEEEGAAPPATTTEQYIQMIHDRTVV